MLTRVRFVLRKDFEPLVYYAVCEGWLVEQSQQQPVCSGELTSVPLLP